MNIWLEKKYRLPPSEKSHKAEGDIFFLSNFDLNEFSKTDIYYCPAPKNINKL